jgi:AhpC/TSA family
MSTNIAEGVATMDQATKANIFHEVLKKRAAGENVDPALWNDFVSAQNDALRTGPGIGEKVPDFTLPDQNGKQHSLQQLMGPKGLLLVFVRSADW